MINQANIGAWIREVQERPESAPLIIREISDRLIELDKLNEQLRAENLTLSSGQKVYLYEEKIAELEHQLQVMARQLEHGPVSELTTANLIIYNQQAQILRLEIEPAQLVSGGNIAKIEDQFDADPGYIRLLTVNANEELLLMFNSGRSERLSVDDIPLHQDGAVRWQDAHRGDLRNDTELILIIPVGKLSIYDQIVQSSRLGYIRKITKNFFQKYISQGNVGKGINPSSSVDSPHSLTLCKADQTLAMVSRDGFVVGLSAGQVPVAVDSAIKLDPNDYVVSTFILEAEQSFVVVSHEGRAVRFEAGWLRTSARPGGKGQAVWSKSKRTMGVQAAGAFAAKEDDWGLGLKQDGSLVAIKVNELPLSDTTKREHLLKNIYPFDVLAAESLNVS